MQVQLPSGRYLFGGNGIDISQLAWIGSWRYVQDPAIECEPGDKLQITLADYRVAGSPLFAVNLVFEGNYKYYLKGAAPKNVPVSALSIPRYQGILNENILAPCWAAGYGPATPAGYRDDYYVYSSPSTVDPNTGQRTGTPIPLAGPTAVTVKIPIDSEADFIVRRLVFDLQADSTVTAGSVLGRLRTGDGYSLNDNFIDLTRYLNGVEFRKPWWIRGGDAVFTDLALADATGTGNMYMMVHLEGAKRKRA